MSAPRIPVDPTIEVPVEEIRDFWRYEFAGRAMQALRTQSAGYYYPDYSTQIAQVAVQDADALLAELEKEGK